MHVVYIILYNSFFLLIYIIESPKSTRGRLRSLIKSIKDFESGQVNSDEIIIIMYYFELLLLTHNGKAMSNVHNLNDD